MSARSTIRVLAFGMSRPGLDDRRRDQDVVLLLPEADHDPLELVLLHLPVADRHPRLGHQVADLRRGLVDRLHPVVDDEDLAVAQQLAADRGGHLLVLPRADVGQHRVPLLGRGEDRRHLADAGQAHLQRARDRGGRHRQDVDRRPHALQVLLVLDAEALLLVDDHQAEVLEPGGRLQQPVGADEDVDLARGRACATISSLSVFDWNRDSTGDGHRELREPLGEGLEVLVGQQRRRHQDGDLLAVLHRLERRPDRDLGLPVADVAADDPVHRDRLHHVGLDLVDGAELVGRLLEREGVLELALPDGVRAEGVPLGRHARRVRAGSARRRSA